MNTLPVEILTKIISCLNPREQVQLQLVSRRFFTLSRDNALWRLHCYETSSSASQNALSTKKTSGSLPAASSVAPLSSLGSDTLRSLIQPRMESTGSVLNEPREGNDALQASIGGRWRAAAEWDPSHETENVDWYSEYIARNGPLAFSWLQRPCAVQQYDAKDVRNVKGVGLLRDWSSSRADKVIAPLEDSSICVWDLNHSHAATSKNTKSKIVGISAPGLLLADLSRRSDKSAVRTQLLDFVDVGECVSIDSIRRRAYIAVGNVVNEVDLETLQVISQERYAWSIFAISQETDYSAPLTLATMLSLQIYDSRSPRWEEQAELALRCEKASGSLVPTSSLYTHLNCQVLRFQPNVLPHRIRSPSPSQKGADYAPLFQPGPLSILHPPVPHVNTILLAGRFPSILCYDRRYFPQLQNTVHSGGRLCGLTSVPAHRFPISTDSHWQNMHTIVACGEYNGKGSLELYKLTSSDSNLQRVDVSCPPSLSVLYQNRQSAASSKLLSVASHGVHIVYSDAEGNIRWIERDGRGRIRQWNINTDQKCSNHPRSTDAANRNSSIFWSSDVTRKHDVVRKILPTDANLTGDELLLWTGDRIGRLSIRSTLENEIDEDEGDTVIDGEFDTAAREAQRRNRQEMLQREREYSGMMRRALETQADEVRWMGRLGMA